MTSSAKASQQPLPNYQMHQDLFEAVTVVMKPADKVREELLQQVQVPELSPQQRIDIIRRYNKIIASANQGGGTGGPVQVLVADNYDTAMFPEMSFSGGAAITTQKPDGSHNNYMLLEKDRLFQALLSDEKTEQLIQVVGHERAHITNGHTSPSGIILGGVEPSTRVQYEMRADINGAFEKRNPEALVAYLHDTVIERIPDYNRKYGTHISAHPTEEEFRQMTAQYAKDDPSHPDISHRMAYLKEEARLMREYEKKHPTENTPEYRKREEDAVVGATMQYALQTVGKPAERNFATPVHKLAGADELPTPAQSQAKALGSDLREHFAGKETYVAPVQGTVKNTERNIV